MRKLEIRARELLAAECAKAYAEPFGAPIDSHEIAVRAIVAALAAIPEGVVGEVVEIGDDEDGQPRILIHTTREAIKAGPPMLFRNVTVSASPPLAASRAEQEPQP